MFLIIDLQNDTKGYINLGNDLSQAQDLLNMVENNLVFVKDGYNEFEKLTPKCSVEVVKEMKALASEFGNLFAQYTAKQQDISVEQRFNEMKAGIDATTETVMEEMKAFDKKLDAVKNNIAISAHRVTIGDRI